MYLSQEAITIVVLVGNTHPFPRKKERETDMASP